VFFFQRKKAKIIHIVDTLSILFAKRCIKGSKHNVKKPEKNYFSQGFFLLYFMMEENKLFKKEVRKNEEKTLYKKSIK